MERMATKVWQTQWLLEDAGGTHQDLFTLDALK